MIENVSGGNENLVVNRGEGSVPSPPPSSEKVRTQTSQSDQAQPAAEVELKFTPQKDSSETVDRETEKIAKTPFDRTAKEEDLEEQLKESVEALNEKLSRLDREILFKVDKKINRNYISVIDKASREIIREFPPEEIRAFIARFDEINEKLMVSTDIKSLIINLEV
jgi:flagellar protein FlaG